MNSQCIFLISYLNVYVNNLLVFVTLLRLKYRIANTTKIPRAQQTTDEVARTVTICPVFPIKSESF